MKVLIRKKLDQSRTISKAGNNYKYLYIRKGRIGWDTKYNLYVHSLTPKELDSELASLIVNHLHINSRYRFNTIVINEF